ncbi:MAG: FAD:protein FMN transferase, partial [Bacteroidales bacterium]|nr:FAD:protein FMN transferase [Bacteroidales bacterium]
MRRFSIIVFVFALLALTSCADRRYFQVTGYAQGGTYSIKYRGASVGPEVVRAKVDSLLSVVDFTLSGYNKNSLLSKLNRGDSVVLTPMFAEVYRLSYEMWELSGGAFDAACGPLFDIWGFGFTSVEMPSDALVAQTLASCGTGRLVS